MAKLALNKSALSREKQRRKSYQRYLPSLELKQKQLLAERKKAQQQLAQHQSEIDSAQAAVYQKLPMLANETIDLAGLVRVDNVRIEEENLMGTHLPTLGHVDYIIAEYGYLARPHWFDVLADSLQSVLKLKLEEQVLHIRVHRLEKASQTITQRVNLFSKVLIPEASDNIKRIGLFLSDQERAGVVRSKLAKRKSSAEGETL
jgi:V/A-type H+-transporting ATPase subunit D